MNRMNRRTKSMKRTKRMKRIKRKKGAMDAEVYLGLLPFNMPSGTQQGDLFRLKFEIVLKGGWGDFSVGSQIKFIPNHSQHSYHPENPELSKYRSGFVRVIKGDKILIEDNDGNSGWFNRSQLSFTETMTKDIPALKNYKKSIGETAPLTLYHDGTKYRNMGSFTEAELIEVTSIEKIGSSELLKETDELAPFNTLRDMIGERQRDYEDSESDDDP